MAAIKATASMWNLMAISYPVLLAVALAVAAVGVAWLLRPPRLRVVVTHRKLWQQAIAETAGRRSWRIPRLATVLLGIGGLALAASAGGPLLLAKHDKPPPVVILLADTPHLAVATSGSACEKDRLIARLGQLADRLPTDTEMLVMVADATRGPAVLRLNGEPDLRAVAGMLDSPGTPPDAADAIALWAPDEKTFVYLLGEFRNVPGNRPNVQWIFRPAPPADDLGITAAGAIRAGDDVEAFVRVERLAGDATTAAVSVEAGPEVPVAKVKVAINRDGVGRAVVKLPAEAVGWTLTVRLTRQDDQTLNNVFYLAPRASAATATFQIVGRPNQWIAQAAGAGDRLREREIGQGGADWLIVNEPADPVSASPGQRLVVIDPLVMPAGVRLLDELTNVRIASQVAQQPWASMPLASVAIRRANRVAFDSRWLTVAADSAGNPLIAVNPADSIVAIFFSVAEANTDWPGRASWPLFWNALAEVFPAGSAAGDEWGWRPGPVSKVVAADGLMTASNIDPAAFGRADGDARPSDEIRKPPAIRSESPVRVWAWLAAAAVVLLLAGWLLSTTTLQRLKKPQAAGR